MHERHYRFALVITLGSLLLAGAAQAGNISGTITYEGGVPGSAKRPLRMDADPGCAKKHSGPVMPEFLVLGEGNALGNVFVSVKSASGSHSTPTEAVVIDQNGCQYSPHVMGVMVNQPFKILNSDGLLHNVHSLPKVNTSFNRAMPGSIKEAEFKFTKPEPMFKIKCDVHPWMGAYVQVMEHPFFDVTGTDGKFEISGLPAGTYEVEAWHEKLKIKTASVTVGASDTQTADFTFTPPKKKK